MALVGYSPTRLPVIATTASAYTLTTSSTAVPGYTISLTPGNWLVTSSMDVIGSTNDVGNVMVASISTVGGSATINNPSTSVILGIISGSQRQSVANSWTVNVTATTTIQLNAAKTAGTGTSLVGGVHTTLIGVFSGP